MRVLIVEDYPAVARALQQQLTGLLSSRAESIDCVTSLESARARLEAEPTDLVFLDLDLGGEDGFELLRWASAQPGHCIVVSANSQRAIEAFEFGVLDFVPKPATDERLQLAVERFDGSRAVERPTARLVVRRRGELEIVNVTDLVRVEAAGKYAELVLRDGTRRLHDKSLERLESILPDEFVRIHRSHIVNLGEAKRLHVEGGGSYQLELRSGERLPVGRSRYASLRASLA